MARRKERDQAAVAEPTPAAARICERCAVADRVIMVEMEPGPAGGSSWWLCFPCWRQGAPSDAETDRELRERAPALGSLR